MSSVNNGGDAWTYFYSEYGSTRTTTVTDPLSHKTVVVSDLNIFQPKSFKDALNRTTNYTYDSDGRLKTATLPEGDKTELAYDARGNITTVTRTPKAGSGLASIVTSASYDATCASPVKCNKPNATTDARGAVTNYTWSTTHGGVLTVERPTAVAGQGVRPKTSYSYTGLKAWYYDAGGNPVEDPNPVQKLTEVSACATQASCAGTADEVQTTIGYGPSSAPNNRLPVSSTSGSGDGALSATTTLGYDLIGNLLTLNAPLSGSADTTTYRYDLARQLSGVIGPDPDGAGALKRRAARIGYNPDGQATRAERGTVNGTTDADWAAFAPLQARETAYDTQGRPVRQTLSAGSTTYSLVQTSYDAASRRTRTTWPDGFYVTYDHDLADEMTAIRENGAASGIGVLASFSYDDLGGRTRLDRGNGVSTTYAWDPAPRLTEIFHNMTSGGNRRIKLEDYNPAGQIVGRSATNDAFAYTGHANVNRAYTVDGLNRVTSTGGTTLSYNPLSDLTNDGTRTYSYDFDDRLTGSGAVSLEYDPAGRLFREQGAADTRFLYDNLDAIGEYDASGTRLRRYVHGPGVDEPLVRYEGPGTAERRWLLADERGSVIAWTTPAGTTGAIDSYDDYGIPASTNVGRFQYTGQMYLPEIGVYHYKARAYHPQLGRFLQPDPIGYASGLNLYAYVRNDPVNLIDPSGLAWICPTPTTCHTVRDGTPGSSCYEGTAGCGGDTNFDALTVTGNRGGFDWNRFDFVTGSRGASFGGGGGGGGFGDAKTCPSGAYKTYSLGADVNGAVGSPSLGVGVQFGIAIPAGQLSGSWRGAQLFISFQSQATIGAGLFGGFGGSGSFGSLPGPMAAGRSKSTSDIITIQGGWGISAGASGTLDARGGFSGAAVSPPTARGGFGAGAYGGVGRQHAIMFVSKPIECGK